MKDFEYYAPKLRETVSLLAEKTGCPYTGWGNGSHCAAAHKRVETERVIDIKHVSELNELSFGNRKGLIIGAGVPCWRIYNDAEVVDRYRV